MYIQLELKKLSDQVGKIMPGNIKASQYKSGEIEIKAKTYGTGITYQQIMKLRELFGCDFHVHTDFTEGFAYSEVTWEPGESFFLFNYQPSDPR